jgi:GH25 family lysozyme M1 (1,4-beta-N-acetylmuramidase)
VALVKGIDVSGVRGDVDWRRVVAQGYRFAFVKATEGLDFHDPQFGHGRWRAMREAGIVRGAYHYARPQAGRRGRDEAAFFLSAVHDAGGLRPGDLPLCLDVEWKECTLTGAQIKAWCSDFCTAVHEATGRDVITYTGDFWRDRVGRLGPPRHGEQLWLPVYGPNDGKTRVAPETLVPRGFRLLMHQWTDKGHVDGVQAQPVDLNVWFGTLAQLRSLCDGGAVAARRPRPRPAPPPPAVTSAAADGAMSVKDVQRALRAIGWPIADDGDLGDATTEAIADFQRGYALMPLRVSGRPGPKTNAALRECVANGGRCSEHFAFAEFRSKGNGWIKVDRALLLGLERYRKAVGGPVEIVSAYRDPEHNEAVGGAPSSQHLFGNAADVPFALHRVQVRALRVFSGIGYQEGSDLVRHVDVRHRGPNTTGGTLANPTEWVYTH